MRIRPVIAPDLVRFLPLLIADPVCGLTPDTYRSRLADGQYRHEWTWIAEDSADGVPLAVAVWWGGPDASGPGALDAVFVDASAGAVGRRADIAAALLTAAHGQYAQQGVTAPPAFHIFVPVDWRDRPTTVEALDWRREAACRAGLSAEVERLRYEWTPSDGLPAATTSAPTPASARLEFHAEPDDEVFVGLFRGVLADTLDAASRQEADRIGAEAQARGDVAFYRDDMPGKRSWWRIARTPDGEVVGFVIPSRNQTASVIGYLGVLPVHRGRGYADDLLAEATRLLVAETDARLIRADTDLTNTPMAAAFERAGYRNSGRRLVLSAP
ncbi:GNAT family N-acetyltransferase [Streptomyces sp. NPDC004732]|uniref:GNAT family N-acetyltransferase n=1 Tax=Streptomyces sp. NPDC004732 TaxID=3154290 RepID=UPI0033A1606D